MFFLVTQADGSARRLTWITYAIAVGFVATFLQQSDEVDIANDERREAISFFNENAYLEVDPGYSSIISQDYAQALNEEFTRERREMGLASVPERLVERAQDEFDLLLDAALAKVERLPIWKFGIRDFDAPVFNWLAHVAPHETQTALMLSLVMLLFLGIALEDGWGYALFGGFAVAGVLVTGAVSAGVGYTGATGLPWFGGSGLIAVLLGAHFIRSLGGAPKAFGMISMPGWLILPIWLACEYAVVRGVGTMSEIVTAPVIVHAAGFGFGAVASLVVAVMGVENKMLDRAKEAKEVVSNPVLDRAMEARQQGRAEQAFDMLRAEFRRNAKNREIALALWDIAVDLGKSHDAADAMIVVVEIDLLANRMSQAVSNWFSLVDEVPSATAPPQVLVRIGEVLFDEGHPQAALSALALAVDGRTPPTTALALRTVRVARDLDPDLTGRAAEIALRDAQLGIVERDELTRLSTRVENRTTETDPTLRVARAPERAPVAEPEPAITNVELDELSSTDPCLAEEDDLSSIDPNAINLEDSITRDLESELVDDLDELEDFDEEDLVAAVIESGGDGDKATIHDRGIDSVAASGGEVVNEVIATQVGAASVLRSLRVRDAIPAAIEGKAIVIEVDNGRKARIPYERIEALATAAVSGIGEKPIVVIDLLVNWSAAHEPMKLIRFRSDQFDPGQLAPGQTTQLKALQTLLNDLLLATDATPLPNLSAATGAPFAVYQGLDAYHREVLGGSTEA